MKSMKSLLIAISALMLFLMVSLNQSYAAKESEESNVDGEQVYSEQKENNNSDEENTEESELEHIDNSPASCARVPYGKPKKLHGSSIIENKGGASSVISPNHNGPVVVDIGLYIVGLTNVDEVTNTFNIEGFIDLIWCDPRQAYELKEDEEGESIHLKEKAQNFLNNTWWPDVSLANQVSERTVENQELVIFPDGTLEYKEKFSAELSAHYDLEKFPFDKQGLEVEIESFAWNEEHLVFHMEEEKIGFSDKFEMAEWRIDDVKTKIESVKEVRDRAAFSEFLMEIKVTRKSGFYLWKVIIPMIVLVMISWSVFWMIGDGLADRMSVSLTGILTVVAYQFTISDVLPKVTYFTFMDTILTLSFFMMALTIFENIIINILYIKEKNDTAQTLDQTCRVLFPIIYLMSILALIFVFYLKGT